MICNICNKEFKTYVGLSCHIRQSHNTTSQEYYDKYIRKEGEGFCNVCQKPTSFRNFHIGYSRFCCGKCVQNSEETKSKIQQTCLDRYDSKNVYASEYGKQKCRETWLENLGVENPFQSEEVKEKIKQTNLERYNSEYSFQSKEIKDKIKNTKEERYGNSNYNNTEKARKTNLEKYGVDCVLKREDVVKLKNSEENKKKQYNTKKKNNTFNTSKIEQELEIELRKIFPKLKTQYKSKNYPFNCDYYIPELDLYIEYNGTWTHGFHFFDKDNQEDLDKLEKWKNKNSKYYNSAIKTWTQRDILKLETAIKNHLNYVVWFNQEQAYEWVKLYNINRDKAKEENK
jgi:csr/mutH/archaeal HJR family nuclease